MDQGQVAGAFEHEDDEGDEMQAGQGLGQALIVSCEPSAAGHPGEAALDHPPSGQQNKTALSGASGKLVGVFGPLALRCHIQSWR